MTASQATSTVPVGLGGEPVVSPGEIALHLKPAADRPRNSEGAFIRLKDGRTMLVYTHFTDGGSDYAHARLDARFSSDEGKTWDAEDTLVLENSAGQNLMSVSLLRLQDGRIAMFYLRKESHVDCRPFVRFSSDEAQTWSDEICCTPTPAYYFVLNNDRVIQLASGRLVVPVALHPITWSASRDHYALQHGALAFSCLSDDGGATWRMSINCQTLPVMPPAGNSGLQEPGVIELSDGRIMMWARTSSGCQWSMYSSDKGEIWSYPQPTEFKSPNGPLSIKRMPSGELLAVWNDHSGRFPMPDLTTLRGTNQRLPLVSAISDDDGVNWRNHKLIENETQRAYCYISIHFTDDNHVLLAYCSGGAPDGGGTLHSLRVRRIPVSDFLN